MTGKTLLTLHLTGPFRATGANGSEIVGLSRRAQAMLAYLSQQPDMRAERTAVADILWSDRNEEQARASLRQELSALRKLLPDGLLTATRQIISLSPAVVSVERAINDDFLKGFDLASEGFEDWLRQSRMESTQPPTGAAVLNAGNRPSLAVLPFEELGAPENDRFADGVVEEITGALSRIQEFHVIARQSSYALQGSGLDVPAIAERLNVAYILEGSVRRARERVRISVQLVRGTDGRTLWSERFDDQLDDLFDMQDRIAAHVAGQLLPSMRSAEIERVRSVPNANRSAYDLVLAAYPHFWSHRAEGNKKALALYDAALAQDPDYPLALAMKAWCHGQEACYIWSEDPARDRAIALETAERAAERVQDHAPTFVAIGAAIALTSADRNHAKSAIDRALVLDPNNAWGWLRAGWLYTLNNEPDLALPAFDRAEQLSPLDPFLFNVWFGRATCVAEQGDYDQAVALTRKGLNMAPGVTWAYRMLASHLAQGGDAKGSKEALDTFLSHYPGMTIKRMIASMPPAIFTTQQSYLEGMRKAGIPEE